MKTNLLKSIFISLILLVGATNAWAVDHTGGYIYFLKPSTWTESKVMMFIGYDTYTSVYEMTKVDNTDNLYRYTMLSWGGATYVAFANAGSVWGSGGWGPSNRTKAPHYTNVYNDYRFDSGSYYIVVPASTSNNAGITINYKSSASNLNLTTRADVYGSTDGGSTYASKAAAGTVSVSGYYMSNYSTASTRSAVSSTSSQAYASTTLAPGSTATFKATASTGYEFVGWFDAASGGTAVSTSTTYTYKYDISYTGKTVYARFKAKQSAITLNQENATTTGTTSLTATYGVTMPTIATLPTRNGYDFAGYFDAKSGGTKYYNADGSSAKNWDKTSNTTLYAQWTAKNITINWNANGGSVTPTSSTYTYDGDAITLPTPSYAGHRFLGWYTAASGGTQITDVGTTNKPYTTVTYYAHWEVSIVEHKVTFGVGTNYTKYGTLTAATSSGSLTSGSNVVEGTSVTFTATPSTGYEVEGWYTNAACTAGKHDAGQTTYTTSITGITNVYVKFVEKTWSVAFTAGIGGYVTTPSSTPQTVGQITGISIAATPATGYTFKQWTITSGSGSFTSAATTNSNKFKPTANSTVTASFTENLYAITVKSSNKDHGTVSQSTDKAGIATTITITATPKLGYKFVNWTATNGITIADANSTTTTITASAAGTVTANFELIPPTTIYVKSNGSYADFKWNYNSVAYDMEKVDCDGTYYTADILGGVEEITLTGSNSFTTTTLTVPTDGKTLYDLTSTNITHLYLKPNSNWKLSNARFAAYFFGNSGNAWQSMEAVGTSGYYKAAVPAGTWTNVIFCRMNPSSNTNGWTQDTQLWNKTADLQFPTNGNNLYTLTGGEWNAVTGSWSTIWDNSRWTTFDAPKLDVKINITGKGSIVIDSETYTSITTGKESFAFTKTSGESITVGAITPADRWALTSSQITMCGNTEDLAASHTINGPATIDLSFTQTSCEVVFNLNLPKGVVIPSWSIANQYVAVDGTATEPSVGEIGDYLFGGWYKNGSTFTDANKYDFSTPVTGDLNLYARWIPYAQCIFFKNTLSWSDVYIYTFTDNAYWNDGTGVHPGTNKLEQGKMTQLDKTDIYYYILTDLTGFSNIAFSDYDMRDYGFFNDHKAIYRSDRSDLMPLFIPQKDQTPTGDTYTTNKYYSSGIWMKYNSTESGYKWSSDKNSWSTDVNPFTASTKGGYTFTTTVSLSGDTKYLFKVNNIKGDWYSKVCTITQEECTNLWFQPESDPNKNAVIQPNVTGDYVFTVYLGDGKVELSLEYPLSVGDYRLAYKDKTENSHHPGHYLKKRSTSQTDIVSFFIHHNQTPEIIVEKCTQITDGVPTWAKVTEITINPAASITESGVYNFYLQQIDGNTLPTLLQKADPYKGNYYIRTDAADGGWDAFRQASNKITYSSFADTHSNFNHYYCKYIDAGRNVKFTIANDYSYCISDTLDNDDIIKKGQSSIGCLPINANVRFGWDSNTNEISRAYIKGAGQTSDRFLVLQGKDDNLKDANGDPIPKGTGVRTGLEANEEILVDQQNWIYQVDVTANNQTFVKLIAEYNGTTQYFKGNEKEYTGLLSSTAANSYKIRLVYDFKSNHLVAAMVLGGDKEVTENDALGTDMMVIRKDQKQAEQLTFNPNTQKLSDVGTVYAVMTFTSDWINGTAGARERSLYWVSFPFDVKISDVFGFGEYAEHWIMQYYDGAERAEKGLFIDSGTYWKYIEDTKTTLKAGQGYVLALDLSKVEFLHGATEVSLYFPSTEPVETISGVLPTEHDVPAHECTIDREFEDGGKTYKHKFTDSHWNLIGVPGFADIKSFDVTSYHFMQDDASFYYNFSLASSTYNVESSATNFQAMHAYMVQFAGNINWKSKTVSVDQPQELAARRNTNSQPEKLTLRLELAQADKKVDQTFVQLQEEGATANFDLSLDLTKIVNKGANIYTLTDSLKIQVAGNVLPFEETTVAVGVDIATAGEYTFRMPDGTEGMIVELIDYETNTRTNLLLSDYTVTLQKGSNENRFALYIQPSKSGVTTGVENVGDKAKGIEKYLIDGKLIIRTAEGVVYDAQGKRL